jgi:hypothetical protein
LSTDNVVNLDDCDPITGVAVAASQEQQNNQHFLDEACVQGTVISESTWWNYFKYSPSYVPQELFSRPWLYSTFAWNTSATLQQTVPLSYATIASNPLWLSHLAGRSMFRATWCFRVEVSASPFMGGWLRLAHQPVSSIVIPATWASTMSRLRQFPGVDFDISSHTSAIFKIPHRSLEQWIGLTSSTSPQHNGFLHVFARTPLNQGDGTAPKLSTWMWFEDVEICGDSATTVGTLVPQGPPPRSNKGPPKNPEETGQKGVLSTFLAQGAVVSDTYLSKIPFLSSYAAPLSWTARVLSKVAGAFGFSRPLDQRPVTVTRLQRWGGFNSTGVETGYMMSLAHDTQVPPVPLAGQNLDQMSIKFLGQSLFPMVEVRVPDTTPSQKLVCSGVLSPYSMLRHPLSNSCCPLIDYQYTLMTPTPALLIGIPSFVPSAALWLSSWFGFWRGSIRFRLLFSKTKLHGGRFVFIWDYRPTARYILSTPGANYTPPSLNIYLPADITAAHPDNKVVIDIRESSDVEIIVPYLAPLSMWPTTGGIGSWGLYMLDPLNHPSTTANYVDVAIEVSMGPDFQLAAYRSSPFIPDDNMTPLLAQSGNVDYSGLQQLGAADDAASVELLNATMGEIVTSIKQPLLLPALLPYISSSVNYWCPIDILRDASNQFLVPNRNNMLDHVRRMYSVERGGVVVTAAIKTSQPDVSTQFDGRIMTPVTGTGIYSPGGVASVYQVNDWVSSTPRFILPRLSPSGGSYNKLGINTIPNAAGAYFDGNYRTVSGPNAANTVLYQSVADDYMATLFLHTVPVCIPNGLWYT